MPGAKLAQRVELCQCYTYVPRRGHVATQTEACVVAASGEDKPVLRRGRAGRGVNRHDILPVLQRNRILDYFGNFGGYLASRRVDWRRWHRRDGSRHGSGCLVEEALHLVEEGDLLVGDGKRREGKDET